MRAHPGIVALAAGGSFISGTLDEFSDLDLVVVVAPTHWPHVLDDRLTLAATFGPLLAAFTGEHVGEPRLLICLYGPPLVHVDLKFLPLDALDNRVEDPVVLWDRTGLVRRQLARAPARYPAPDLQWIEDRLRRMQRWRSFAMSRAASNECGLTALAPASGSPAAYARAVSNCIESRAPGPSSERCPGASR